MNRRLNATLLARTTAVVRDRRYVFDQLDIQPSCLQRGDGAFTTRARTLHADFNVSHAKLGCLFRSLLSGALPSKRGALSTSFESARTGTCPAQRITLGIGDRHGRIIERGVDVRDATSDIATDPLFLVCLCHSKVSNLSRGFELECKKWCFSLSRRISEGTENQTNRNKTLRRKNLRSLNNNR